MIVDTNKRPSIDFCHGKKFLFLPLEQEDFPVLWFVKLQKLKQFIETSPSCHRLHIKQASACLWFCFGSALLASKAAFQGELAGQHAISPHGLYGGLEITGLYSGQQLDEFHCVYGARGGGCYQQIPLVEQVGDNKNENEYIFEPSPHRYLEPYLSQHPWLVCRSAHHFFIEIPQEGIAT